MKEKHFDEGVVNYEKFLESFGEHYVKKMDKQQLIFAFPFLDKRKAGSLNSEELKYSLMVIEDRSAQKENWWFIKRLYL